MAASKSTKFPTRQQLASFSPTERRARNARMASKRQERRARDMQWVALGSRYPSSRFAD
jgi:hypothetical protein